MVTTYQKLSAIVLGYLVHYQTDLTHHDRIVLENYDGPFVYAYRKSGTDLVRLDPNADIDGSTVEGLKGIFIYIDYGVKNGDRNSRFLYFDGTDIHEKTCDELRVIFYNYVDNLFKTEEWKNNQSLSEQKPCLYNTTL